ncbi:hypothetical protein BP5796_03380 [Coleophoma crateriformis]|uniref:Uncharacterized protein n=1 Tax=Coleophoma crateriformis TaxID=565419 RepID=A0A3D8SN22_9HELO|nr:hypothetical protein BP5796_03380 [Coleophoma crateriformis]
MKNSPREAPSSRPATSGSASPSEDNAQTPASTPPYPATGPRHRTRQETESTPSQRHRSAHRTTTGSQAGGRVRKAFAPQAKLETAATRRRGACDSCREKKTRCSEDHLVDLFESATRLPSDRALPSRPAGRPQTARGREHVPRSIEPAPVESPETAPQRANPSIERYMGQSSTLGPFPVLENTARTSWASQRHLVQNTLTNTDRQFSLKSPTIKHLTPFSHLPSSISAAFEDADDLLTGEAVVRRPSLAERSTQAAGTLGAPPDSSHAYPSFSRSPPEYVSTGSQFYPAPPRIQQQLAVIARGYAPLPGAGAFPSNPLSYALPGGMAPPPPEQQSMPRAVNNSNIHDGDYQVANWNSSPFPGLQPILDPNIIDMNLPATCLDDCPDNLYERLAELCSIDQPRPNLSTQELYESVSIQGTYPSAQQPQFHIDVAITDDEYDLVNHDDASQSMDFLRSNSQFAPMQPTMSWYNPNEAVGGFNADEALDELISYIRNV